MIKRRRLTISEIIDQAILKDEDKPYEIPGNWVWTRLRYCADWGSGGTPSRENPEYFNGNIPWVKTGELNNDIIYNSEEKISELALNKSSAKLYPVNTVIIAMYGATIGKVGILGVEAATNQACACGVSLEFLNYKYLFYYALSQRDRFVEKGKGGAQPNISQEVLKEHEIPIPPILEQQRIVSLLDSLFEKLDYAKELVENAISTFENRRATILRKAFSGKLTTSWREKNSPEHAKILINQLYNVRINSAESSSEKAKIEKIFNYREIGFNKELPHTWCFVSLDKICKSFQYGTSKKSAKEGGVVVLRMGNLQSGRIDWSDLAYSSDKYDIDKFSLNKGDVLFNRTNSPELVGKTSIYDGEMPAIFAGYLIRINNFPQLDSYYLNYFLNSPLSKDYFKNVKSDGVNQSNINAQKLAKLELAYCSIDEQKEIVRILDYLLENEQKALEKSAVLENIEQIRKSVLTLAFCGKLNTNNASEISINELLIKVLKKRVEESTNNSKIIRNEGIEKNKLRLNKKESITMPKDILEVLRENNAVLSPIKLYRASGLKIEDFYDSLKQYVECGKIVEVRKDDGEVYLEACHENK